MMPGRLALMARGGKRMIVGFLQVMFRRGKMSRGRLIVVLLQPIG